VLAKYRGTGLKQSLGLIGSVSKHCATAVLPEIGFCLEKIVRTLKEKKAGPLSAAQFRLLGQIKVDTNRNQHYVLSEQIRKCTKCDFVSETAGKICFHFRDIFPK
jgi:hypothetical protein